MKPQDRYRAGNEAAARVILADVEKHGGETALMVRWARMTVRDIADEAGKFAGPVRPKKAERVNKLRRGTECSRNFNLTAT